MEHIAQHESKLKMIIPYAAITNNIDMSIGDIIITSDFQELEVIYIDYIHIFSETARKQIYDLYKITPEYYAKIWYNKLGGLFSSMILINLTLKFDEIKDVTTKTVSK